MVTETITQKRSWINSEIASIYEATTKNWSPGVRYTGTIFRIPQYFKIKEIIDGDFFENPNLDAQYNIQTKSSGSALFDAVLDTAAETYAEKKIQEANKKTTSTLVLYARKGDPENYYLDFLFFNKSFVRSMSDVKIYLFYEDKTNRITITQVADNDQWEKTYTNEFWNLVTFPIPVEFINGITEGHNKLLVNVCFDYVSIKAESTFSDVDIYALDYSINGEKWSDIRVEQLYPAFCERKLINQIKSYNIEDPERIITFLKSPSAVSIINEYANFCENYDIESTFINFCNSIAQNYDTQLLINQAVDFSKRSKNQSRWIKVLKVLGILSIAICLLGVDSFLSDEILGSTIVIAIASFIIRHILKKRQIPVGKELLDFITEYKKALES